MALAGWIDGWRRVARARGLALAIHVMSFLLALPLAALLRDQIAAQLGSSLTSGVVADSVSYDWWTEFTAQASTCAGSRSRCCRRCTTTWAASPPTITARC